MPRGNGGIIGPANIPTTTSAKGIWSLMEQLLAQRQGIWPSPTPAGYTVIQTFTATSTWTCPTGVTEVEYLVVAGGGGGGSTTGGGGGAGGFRTGTAATVSAGTDYVITVGAAGTAGSGFNSAGSVGGNGGTSSIVGGTSPSPFASPGVALEGVELTMLIQMGVLGIHQINRLLAVTALLPFLIRALMVGIMDQ
jgi:hypothetical protein